MPLPVALATTPVLVVSILTTPVGTTRTLLARTLLARSLIATALLISAAAAALVLPFALRLALTVLTAMPPGTPHILHFDRSRFRRSCPRSNTW